MFFFRFVLSVLISSFVFLCSIESKSIPLIGLFTDDEINRNSSKLIIDYALNRFKALKHLRNNFVIQRDQNEIPCDMAIGTKFVFDMIHQTPRPLAIFSGSCQTVASAIAETAAIYDMTIVSRDLLFFLHAKLFDIFFFSFEDGLFWNEFTVHCSRQISIVDTNSSWWFSTQHRSVENILSNCSISRIYFAFFYIKLESFSSRNTIGVDSEFCINTNDNIQWFVTIALLLFDSMNAELCFSPWIVWTIFCKQNRAGKLLCQKEFRSAISTRLKEIEREILCTTLSKIWK